MVSCQCLWKKTLIEKKTSWNKKQVHNKLRSQIKNVVVRATIKYFEHGEICKELFYSVETNNCDKNNIAYDIEC